MVLCVCAIAYKGDGQLPPQVGNDEQHTQQQQAVAATAAGKQAQVQLTDGWYGIRAILDIPLTHLLQKGCLQLGEPLVASSAQKALDRLVGCQLVMSGRSLPSGCTLPANAVFAHAKSHKHVMMSTSSAKLHRLSSLTSHA